MSDPTEELVSLIGEHGAEALSLHLGPWRQVADKADVFFARVLVACGPSMRCRPGCAECCQQDLEVLFAEALALLLGLSRLPAATRGALAEAAARPGPGCALLDPAGRCAVYDLRPLICRTHGLPLRQAGPGWHSCRLNFTSEDPAPGPDCVLNEGLLTAGLTVADGLIRSQLGGMPTQRFSIRALVLALP